MWTHTCTHTHAQHTHIYTHTRTHAYAVQHVLMSILDRDHAAMLDEEVDSFKTLTALLLSSMKSFVTFRQTGQKGADEAQENRNYYVQAMVDSIDEMIRVLQLFEAHEDLIGKTAICYQHSL